MVRITQELVRKRAEHNNLEISTLEEISLHQQDIECIEHLDNWCRDLKILYLQSNLIPKIEHVGRLKNLVYLNLALNNVERVENLEGCESLEKLDLTVNFVGELSSIKCLRDLCHFRELYLVGNPCVDFDYYREYVVAVLPQLKKLDGKDVEKSERIKAVQDFYKIEHEIHNQETEYKRKRAREKADIESTRRQTCDDKETHTNSDESSNKDSTIEDDAKIKSFWEEKTAFTPESRIDVHEHTKALKEKEDKKNAEPEKKPRRLVADDGRRLNTNEARVDFSLTDNEDGNHLLLDLAVFRHMDTSLIDVDVQTDYVLAYIKGKVFQLTLPEEVRPDASKAERSQTTGHLLITMPKARHHQIKPIHVPVDKSNSNKQKNTRNERETLEVDPRCNTADSLDFANIVSEKGSTCKQPYGVQTNTIYKERENSKDFVDDPDVPPLMGKLPVAMRRFE